MKSFLWHRNAVRMLQNQQQLMCSSAFCRGMAVFIAVLLCSIGAAYSQKPSVDTLIDMLSKKLPSLSDASFVIRNLDNDSVVAAYNGDVPMNPASVSKLATAAAAFEKLGTNYLFKTYAYADSGSYNPITGQCRGNLYIKAGGDPSLFIERLWLFVEYLRSSAGLTAINGDIVLDDSFFDTVTTIPFFNNEVASNPYATPVNALSANFNCVTVYVRPGDSVGAPAVVRIFPDPDSTFQIQSTAYTGESGSENTCKVSTEKHGSVTRILVAGSVPAGSMGTTITRTAWQTWEYAGALLKKLLRANGVVCAGTVRRGVVPASAATEKPLYVYQSPPLCDLVNGMMKYSNNFYAEMIFKTLSATADSGGGSWEKSSHIIQNWWKDRLLPGSPVIVNGSGLGNANRLSASQVVALLCYVWKQKTYMPEYVAALPLAGVDGTLRSRFKGTPLAGAVRGKTGTLNDLGVCTIAGYVFLPSGSYAYAILFNTPPTEHSTSNWELQEKILEILLP